MILHIQKRETGPPLAAKNGAASSGGNGKTVDWGLNLYQSLLNHTLKAQV